MKTISNFCRVFLLPGFVSLCQAQQATQQAGNLPPPTSPVIVSRAANARIWERIEYQQGPNGQVIPIKHHVTEIADGVCYQDPNSGQWMDSQEQITIQPDGSAAAVNGRHHASFPADIYEGAITLTTPEGLQLRSQPILLSYESGTNIIPIATLTNSVGQLISSNQIIYTNAFTGAGVDADLLYIYRYSGIEQDVVFRQQLPAPEQFGLNSADTRLQLLTEFFDPPAPAQAIGPVNPQDGLQDTSLSFGSMTMTHGRAFLTSASQNNFHSVSVYKSWIVVDGRTLLVEEVPYERLSPDLATLPQAPAVNPQNSTLRKASPKRVLPPMRLVQTSTNTVHLAKNDQIPKPGVTFDYVAVNSGETNFTFQGDTVYYVSANCLLAGKTTIEGASILKFNSSGALEIAENGTLDCQTAPFRPAVLTSVNDDSIGEPIWGISSGTPNFNDDQNVFITIDGTNAYFHDLRFSYGWQAVSEGGYYVTNFFTIRNCQFYDLLAPVYAYQIYLYNDLIGYSTNEVYGSSGILAQGDPEIWIEGTGGGLVAENVTSDFGYGFINADGTGQTIALTNCLVTSQILTNQDNWATLQTNAVVNLPSPSVPVYQVVGGGNYYLTNGSPYREHGTANIDPDLYVDLAAKTTYPPCVYSGTNISSLGTLGQCVARDTNTLPDIGYHYDPLDYAFGGCDLYSNLTITTGTAVA